MLRAARLRLAGRKADLRTRIDDYLRSTSLASELLLVNAYLEEHGMARTILKNYHVVECYVNLRVYKEYDSVRIRML